MIFADHSVLLKKNELRLAVFICVKSKSLLHVFLPIALISGAICVIKDTITLSDTIYPLTLISVSNVLSLAFWFKPNMHTPAFLMVIFPFSDVFLSDICPIHGSLTFFLVILPFTFKVVSWRIVIHFSVPLLKVIFKGSFKNTSALKNYFAFARFFTLKPLAFVGGFFDRVFSKAVPESILNLSFINTTVRPSINPMSGNSVISKLALVLNTVAPNEFAFSVQ